MEHMPTEAEMEELFREVHQAARLPLEQGNEELCPECPYKTSFCVFNMVLHLGGPLKGKATFVCKGMRAWIRITGGENGNRQ